LGGWLAGWLVSWFFGALVLWCGGAAVRRCGGAAVRRWPITGCHPGICAANVRDLRSSAFDRTWVQTEILRSRFKPGMTVCSYR
jgi:hypothetical protein